MKNHDSIEHNDIVAIDSESQAIVNATNRMKRILEAKCEAANIKNVVAACKNFSTTEQKQLFAVLTRFESLFYGTPGHWQDETYDITLRHDAKPYHARAYPIPKIYEATFKMEV
jgi:hypothetical protein